MLHYRLVPSNNRSRMFIAVLLATTLHLGLIKFEFTPKPVVVPSVTLPHSVSIFLQHNSLEKTSEQPVNKTQDINPIKKEVFKTEKEPVASVLENPPVIIEKQDSSIQSEALLNKKVYEQPETAEKISITDIDEIDPLYYETEIKAEDSKGEPKKNIKVQKVNLQADSQIVQQEEGKNLPGTLQLAYPRYQENAPPNYPALARKRGQEGAVILQVLVNREGRVDELEIDTSSGFTLLDRAALSAVRKWSFEPGMRGEERIPMWVKVPVTFKLK